MRALEATVDRYPALIVFACIVGMALGAPIFLIYGFGVFIDPIGADLEVGRGLVGTTVFAGLLGNLIAGPAIGILSDRFGARRMTLISVVALAAVLACFSLVQNIAQLYAAAFVLVLVGAGTGPVTFSRIIAGWFNERRGLALGFALTGIGLGGAIAPIVSQYFISEMGWRTAYQYLALMVIAISLPVLWLLLRQRSVHTDEARGEEGVEVGEAIRSGTFWIIAFGFLMVAIGNTGGLLHLVPILTDAGLSAERASWYAGALGIGVIGGRVLGGFLIDIFHAPWVAIVCLAGPLLAYAFFVAGIDPEWAVIPVILFGIGMGAEFDVIPFLVSRYFGLRNFGVLYGIQILTFSIGSGIGPAVQGFGSDKYGSYGPTLIAAMFILLAGAALISRLGPYRFK